MTNSMFVEEDYINFCQLPNNYFVVTNGTDRFVKFSLNWCDLLEYSEEELRNISFFDLIHPDDIAKTLSTFSKLSSSHVELSAVGGFLNRYVSKSGKIVWLYWSAKDVGNGVCYSIAQEVTSLITKKSTKAQFKTKDQILELLTSTELELFRILLEGQGKSVSKKTLTVAVYGEVKVQDQTINVHISNIRKKIKGSAYLIKNVGKGHWRMIDKTKPIPSTL